VINKVTTILFGPARSAYFEMGNITNLAVSPSHAKDANEAVWPVITPIPALSWTNAAPNAVKFFVDVSTLDTVPVGDKVHTVTVGSKGILATSYQLTSAEWKKVRQLAAKSEGVLYWRVRGTDKDGLLGAGSAAKMLVIDAGDWVVNGPANVSASPASFSWTHTGDGLIAYCLQFSVDDDFQLLSAMTVKIPSSPVAYATGYTLTAADQSKLVTLAMKNGRNKLYYRVLGQDAEKVFAGHSGSQTIDVP
jgi:hypothetical protein